MPQFEFTTSEEKKTYVRTMFSDIARRYDFLNHLLSLGLDRHWRKKAVQTVKDHLTSDHRLSTIDYRPKVLDIACGTGDLSFEILKQIRDAKITGIDLAKPMLEIFQKKASERKAAITLEEGDVEALQFPDNSFDAIMIGFATRNFTRLDIAFKEIHRVLKPGGIFVNLELSKPRGFPMKQLYRIYSKILPMIGKIFSKKEAYAYLPNSIMRFPEREEIMQMLYEAGFSETAWKDLSAGIVTMHIAKK